MAKSVGILTGGGDCPGLNAVIRAVVAARRRRGLGRASRVREGWRGLVEPIFERSRPAAGLGDPAARRHDHRHDPHEPVQGRRRRRAGAAELPRPRARRARRDRRRGHARRRVAPLRRASSSRSSACRRRSTTTSPAPTTRSASTPPSSIATEAIDRLHTTAESHNRVMVVEVMGRHAGWIAVHERHRRRRRRDPHPRAARSTSTRSRETIRSRHARGKNFSIVVVSEGCELPGRRGHGRGRPVRARDCSRSAASASALGRRDRGAHRLRDARHRARPRPARRLADRRATACSRRASGSRPRTSSHAGRVRPDGRAARRRRRRRARSRRRPPS